MSTLAVQFAWLEGTTVFPGAAAYRLPPMWMVDGNLAAGRFRWEMNDHRERLVVSKRDVPVLADVAFSSSSYGNRFFGHHLSDDLPLALAAAEYGDPWYANPPDQIPVNIGAYRDVCGIDHPSIWTARVDRCWVFQDAHLNDSKLGRLETMRASIASGWGPGAGHERVYIRRGPTGVARGPANEPALIAALEADGWVVIDPESMTTAEVARSLFDARLVAGIEGSQLSHAIFALRRGAGVVAMIPPNRFNLLFKDFFDRLGIRFGFHVGTMNETGWEVAVDGAKSIIEHMEGLDAP